MGSVSGGEGFFKDLGDDAMIILISSRFSKMNEHDVLDVSPLSPPSNSDNSPMFYGYPSCQGKHIYIYINNIYQDTNSTMVKNNEKTFNLTKASKWVPGFPKQAT